MEKKYPWRPLSVSQIEHFLGFNDFILAGGYALSAFVGKDYREHDDIDVIIKREDQNLLFSHLGLDQIFIADANKELRPMDPKVFYDKPAQDIWILNEELDSWCLQVMLVDHDEDDNWVFKRNTSIRIPWNEIYWQKNGMNILLPELLLLYKSSKMRPKDKVDFETVFPLLDENVQDWFDYAFNQTYKTIRKIE